MQFLKKFFLSMTTMGFLLCLLIVFLAIATFIESYLGKDAAWIIVYKAKWFELLFFWIAIVLIYNIFHQRLIFYKKWTVLIFHLSFLIILLGAIFTRYFGFQGMMHIREGESIDYVLSNDSYINVQIFDKEEKIVEKKYDILLSPFTKNRFKKTFYHKNQKFIISLENFIPNAQQKLIKSKKGTPILKLVSVENDDSRYDALVFNIKKGNIDKSLFIYGKNGLVGNSERITFGQHKIHISYGSITHKLPYSLYLQDFVLERYPGSTSPSSFISKILLHDKKNNKNLETDIFMNNVLSYGGYRFYQSSYDKDEKGTFLSVNQDKIGTKITYFGYFLLFLGMLMSIFKRGTRLQKLFISFKKPTILIIFFFLSRFSFSTDFDSIPTIPKDAAYDLSKVCVQDMGGRIKPLHTLTNEVILKIIGKRKFNNYNAQQVFFSMMAYPNEWQKIPLIKVKNKEIQNVLGIKSNYASFYNFFHPKVNNASDNPYKLTDYVDIAYRKNPEKQNHFDKDIIKIDEKFSICYMIYAQQLLRIFPDKNSTNSTWVAPNSNLTISGAEKSFIQNGVNLYLDAVKNNKKDEATIYLNGLYDYQKKYGLKILPSPIKTKIEILYNKLNIFSRLFPFYLLIGILYTVLLIISTLKPNLNTRFISKLFIGSLIILFVFQTIGLGLRWYIAGHAPWSNGYESMIYIAWITMLAGFVFCQHSKFSVSVTAGLNGLFLMVAHLNWMNPEITNLVPVLKSYWLTIHVAVIIASYGFFALGAFLAMLNLLFFILSKKSNAYDLGIQIKKLTKIIECSLIIGLYFFTIGTFLGGIWANQSWGRYWAWDPKEVWALISILVYVFVLHLHLITKSANIFIFNTASFLAFSSIVMTYIGVNFFLTGLHSYAGGDSFNVSAKIWLIAGGLAIYIFISYRKFKKHNKSLFS